jgi:hypothetical protein
MDAFIDAHSLLAALTRNLMLNDGAPEATIIRY